MATDRMSDGWEETRFGGFFVACHPWRQPFGPSQATSKIVPDDFLLPAIFRGKRSGGASDATERV